MPGAPDILFLSECIAKSTFSSAKQQNFIEICDLKVFLNASWTRFGRFLFFILPGVKKTSESLIFIGSVGNGKQESFFLSLN